MRTFSTCSTASIAAAGMKWMSATSGTAAKPAALKPLRIGAKAWASFTPGAVMRMIWQPLSARLMHCAMVAATSWVGVVHMLWTTTGAGRPPISPPTWTAPTITARLLRREKARRAGT